MGATSAAGFAEAVGDGDISLDQALSYHLQCNHYPPVPASMVPVCKAAIDAINAEEFDKPIDLPEGVSFKGQTTAPAWEIAEQHHLHAFLDQS